MEDLTRFCCENPDCPDYGQRGIGNLRVSPGGSPSRKHPLPGPTLTLVGRFGRWPIATSGA
jgi:hypothetical protein